MGKMKNYRMQACRAAGLALVLASCAQAAAATYTWNNAAGGDWNTAANWNPNTGTPVSADQVNFNNSTYATPYTVTIANDTITGGKITVDSNNQVTIANAPGAIGTKTLSNMNQLWANWGTLNFNGLNVTGSGQYVLIGNNYGHATSLTLTNGTTMTLSSGTFTGSANGFLEATNHAAGGVGNSMIVEGGSVFNYTNGATNRTYQFLIGERANQSTLSGHNSVLVTGSGSQFNVGQGLRINSAGTTTGSTQVQGGSSIAEDGNTFTVNMGASSTIGGEVVLGTKAGGTNNKIIVDGAGSSLTTVASTLKNGTTVLFNGTGLVTVGNGTGAGNELRVTNGASFTSAGGLTVNSLGMVTHSGSGAFTAGALTVADNTRFVFTIGSGMSAINISSLTATGINYIDIGDTTLDAGTYTLFSGADFTSNTTFTLGNVPTLSSGTLSLVRTTDALILNVASSEIPEPASVGIIAIGIIGLLSARRKRS